DTVSGVPHQPVEILAKNLPVNGNSNENVYASYLTDSWRPTNRVTMNLGLRWERQVHWVPPGFKNPADLPPFRTAAPIGTSGPFGRLNAGAWSRLAPRLGVAYDLFGNGKTVAKGTYGWFNEDLLNEGYALQYSPNQLQQWDYRWHDLNGDKLFEPGEANL